jgi:hypothetical protein
MPALNFADSLIPITRIVVITSAIRNAGRLNPISRPKMCGAFSSACACASSSGRRMRLHRIQRLTERLRSRHQLRIRRQHHLPRHASVATSTPSSGRRPATAETSDGRSQKLNKVFDQPELTVLAPIAYSSVRSQPMIHANNSPSVAYAYV